MAGVENLRKKKIMYWYTGVITFKTLNQKAKTLYEQITNSREHERDMNVYVK